MVNFRVNWSQASKVCTFIHYRAIPISCSCVTHACSINRRSQSRESLSDWSIRHSHPSLTREPVSCFNCFLYLLKVVTPLFIIQNLVDWNISHSSRKLSIFKPKVVGDMHMLNKWGDCFCFIENIFSIISPFLNGVDVPNVPSSSNNLLRNVLCLLS